MANMIANVEAEATGRTLATRLYEMTDGPGMRDMLRFLLARDTMHQNRWTAVIEELGGNAALPVPNSFPQGEELDEFTYTFVSMGVDGIDPPSGRFTSGPSIDGKGEFSVAKARPVGEEPRLAPHIPHAQVEEMDATGRAGAAFKNMKNRVGKAVDHLTGKDR